MHRFFLPLIFTAVGLAQYPIVTVPPPPAPLVNAQPIGLTGFTPYYYAVIAHYPAGTAQSQIITVQNGNANLSATNYNQIGWQALPGVLSYDILRLPTNAFTGSCTCFLGTATNTSLQDQGGAVTAYTLGAAAPAASAQTVLDNTDYGFPKLRLLIGNVGGQQVNHLQEIPSGASLPIYSTPGDLFIVTGTLGGCYISLFANTWTPCGSNTSSSAAAAGTSLVSGQTNALTSWGIHTLGAEQRVGTGAFAPRLGNTVCNPLYVSAGISCVNVLPTH